MQRNSRKASSGRRLKFLLGVDIGGTFTDLVLSELDGGRQFVGKVLTTYDDLASGVLQGIHRLLAQSGVLARDISKVVHGTTLATNALIERRGPKAAMVVTRGFRDVLEMARESRYDIFDIDLRVPIPLIPRRLVFEVSERIDAQGLIVERLDADEVRKIASELRALDVKGAAVCLLHSFRNPVHEKAIAEILAAAAPGISISLSHDVMPDVREYERASTTAANAYVQPLVRSYLDRLATGLRDEGIAAEPMLITSDGGTIGCAAAQQYPIRLVESGPAGGVLAASFLGERAGVKDLIAFDMGGTTAKVCVIDQCEPERSDQFEVARVHRFAKGSGLPLKLPVLEMIEIGAGGGSIARIDELGLLRVGPESAAADPGPACYGLGGDHSTVTDADLVLGYLDPDYFLGGSMHLDRDRASAAITRHIAKPLNMSVTRAAWGIHAVVNDNMARAAKVHCLERGKDPRDYVLLAFGGAGPVHAAHVAGALGIRRVLYPLRAGVMSAFGFLVAPCAFERMQADVGALETVDLTRANAILSDLAAGAQALVRSAGVAASACRVRREATLRFSGQSYGLPVSLAPGQLTGAHIAKLRRDFLSAYRTRYYRLNPDAPVELVSWRVTVMGPRPKLRMARATPTADNPRKGTRPVYLPDVGDYVECPVYDRFALQPGRRLRGPFVVEEPESTVVVGARASATLDRDGNLLATLPAAEAAVRIAA